MKSILLHIYDSLSARRRWLWTGLAVVVAALIGMSVSLRYNEDIMDFLPVDDEDREALALYQSQQSASRLVLIVEGDSLREEAIEACEEVLPDLTTEIDLSEQLSGIYSQMPYFIADSVYDRLDGYFSSEAVRASLERDKLILSTPGTSFLAPVIQADPLGLINLSGFTPPSSANRSYAFYQTPYGSTETRRNAALIDSLQTVASEMQELFPDLNLRWIGAPLIAVGNARRIKLDTVLCIALSLVLIIILLVYAFPRRRDLWFILMAVSFGWLTGMAVLRMVTPTISAVVLGIGSVLIGIAVNYPLHLLVHQRYTSSVRQTLDEVLSPLVVGNITTVGAFLTLIPLQATALKHLGIFAASMLVGTILFCIFVLPHLMSAEPTPVREIRLPLPTNPKGIAAGQWVVVVLTLVAGAYLWLKPSERFDANLNHINYMTPEQRADLAYFDSIANPQREISEHAYRAELWQAYWQTHEIDSIITCIQTEAAGAGFRPEAFTPFYDMLKSWLPVKAFDMRKLTQGLSDNFDYIGLCCSLIVLLFLWLSFRNLWLALIAFVPMALSWVWILATMQLLGLQFNIVNIILATFIFGQGDDYTIFIVEGLMYEHRTGKPILPQYRQSILLSALIMLIGVGILVLAVHPAMHSLGAVTLIGMLIVLLMAVTIPPLLFRLYVRFFPEK
ncbi:MAG: MMPL family transporter [Paludibacteraceae bacterium]|nr:MMPL family transporter [Paludibacteraceae bacterium]